MEARLARHIADKAAERARRTLGMLVSDDKPVRLVIDYGKLSWEVIATAPELKAGNVFLKTLPSPRSALTVDRQIDLAHPPITDEAVGLLNAIAALAPPRQ